MSELTGAAASGDNSGAAGAPAGAPAGAGADGGHHDPWYASMDLDDTTRGYIENKGWKDPAAVVQSYQNLEKLLGADKAGRAVVLPKDDNPEAWNQVWDKLGRPSKPEEYELPVPVGHDTTFAGKAAEKFHELGIPKQQAQALVEWWNDQVASTAAEMSALKERESARELEELKGEWGQDEDKMVEAGRRAVREFGVEETTLARIEAAIGPAQTMKLFGEVGKGLLEHTFHDDGSANNGFGMSPEAARAKINQLKQDNEWVKRYLNRDARAVEEMTRLQRLAAGN